MSRFDDDTQTQHKTNLNCEAEVRYAHIDGHTELAWIPRRQHHLVTVGIDCEVRLWCFDGQSEGVKESFPVEDSAYSITATKDNFFVALTTNCVKSHKLENGDEESTLCRFSANATTLAIHPDGELIAAGGADFRVKLINVTDRSEKNFEGHQGPLLSIAIDPLRKYLATSSCDGSVIIWSIDSRSVQHQWKSAFPKSNDFENSSTLCRIAFEPKFGELLAIPLPECLELYKRGQWDSPYRKVTQPELVNLSIADFSSDGDLLACCTNESVVWVWQVDQLNRNQFAPYAKMHNYQYRITAMRFNPNDPRQFACCDHGGSLKTVKILGKGSQNAPVKDAEAKPVEKPVQFDLLDDMLDDDLDEDFDFLKKDKQVESKKEETKVDKQVEKVELDNTQKVDEDEDAAEFDIGAIKSQYEPMIFGSEDDVPRPGEARQSSMTSSIPSKMSSSTELVIDGYRITGKDLLSLVRGPRYQAPIRQGPFQSGSTPIHYKQRFMVWNSVGIVYGYNSDEGERSIDVEFHDVAFHHSIHLTNAFNYTIADLSTSSLVLASNGDDEAEDELERNKARLMCTLFQTWDQIKEWTVDLPENEEFETISSGQTFVAAVTSMRYLRVWTVGGIQTSILSLDGPSINLSAYDRFLMVVYHSAVQHPEVGQSVSCMVLKVDHRGKTRNHPIAQSTPVALSPKATVYWAGFTDEGTPCVVDSDGIIRLYKSHFGYGWYPICATKEHANGMSDNFFIIGLSEIQSQVRCIFCKASRYPDTVPKPTLTILPLQIPLCEMFTNKSKHEEECLRNRWLTSLLRKLSLDGYDVDGTLEESDKKIINSLIKLFALALGAERESLALEIAKLMPNSAALEGAVRYAERQKHRSLAMKLVEMIQNDDEEEEEDERNSDTELHELMSRKNTDKLRELLREDRSADSMIPLARNGNNAGEDSGMMPKLKPKSLNAKKEKSPIQVVPESDDEEEEIRDNEDDEEILRPKKMFNIKSGTKNPFKVQPQSKSRKRKPDSDEEEEEVADDAGEVDEIEEDFENEGQELGFENYFEANRAKIYEEHEDEIDDEDDLEKLSRKLFNELAESERKKWQRKSKRKPKSSSGNKKAKSEPSKSVNTITNFFKRN